MSIIRDFLEDNIRLLSLVFICVIAIKVFLNFYYVEINISKKSSIYSQAKLVSDDSLGILTQSLKLEDEVEAHTISDPDIVQAKEVEVAVQTWSSNVSEDTQVKKELWNFLKDKQNSSQTSWNSNIVTVWNDKELWEALVAYKSGEIIELKAWEYGKIFLKPNISIGGENYGYIPEFAWHLIIRSEDPLNKAVVNGVDLRMDYIHVKDLEIIGERKKYSNAVYINGWNDIIIDSNLIHYWDSSTWTAEDWLENAHNGIGLRNWDRVTIVNNYIRDVSFWINATWDYAKVIGNTINRFRWDGMRLLWDHSVASNNFIKNSVKADINHDDCIQSWSRWEDEKSGKWVITDVVIQWNVCLLYDDPSNPLYGREMQGIGMFDWFYKDFVIENNLIMTTMYHGLTVLGGENVVMKNNTSMDIDDVDTWNPWIRISDHKDKRVSINSRVENNISSWKFIEASWVTQSNNLYIPFGEYSKYFQNSWGFDFRLKSEYQDKNVWVYSIKAWSDMLPFDINSVMK